MAASESSMKRVIVTGANSGIGYALCKLLIANHGCYVYMCCRNAQRGQASLQKLQSEVQNANMELVILDVSDPASITACAQSMREKLGEGKLYGLVNNAGTGEWVGAGCSREDMINTNVYGPKLMTEAFADLLDPTCGRIVNTGSGSGPMFVNKLTGAEKTFWSSQQLEWEELHSAMREAMAKVSTDNSMGAYGVTKATLHKYTEIAARQYPQFKINALSPGFIDTGMTANWGASNTPEQGCVSTIHCLFAELQGNGWYYGSDGVRSPLHFMRNPGEPAFEGY